MKLHRRSFPATSIEDSLAVVCLVHGLGEHSGRYSHVANHLNQSGLDVETFDLRGHGLSEGKRGHTPDYDYLMNDIQQVLSEIYASDSKRKIVLYGHSTGGNLVLNYALQQYSRSLTKEPEVITRSASEMDVIPDSLIVSAPLLKPAKDPPAWKVLTGRFLYYLLPSFSLDNGIDENQISSDPAVVDAYRKDSLNHGRVTSRMGISVLRQGKWALENAGFLKVPTLLMHGEQDELTSFQASKDFAQNAGKICEFRAWPDMKHEIHNEFDQESVLSYMSNWILQRIEERG